MKNKVFVVVCIMIASLCLCSCKEKKTSSPKKKYSFQYQIDFSEKVIVPDTSSTVVRRAQKMNKKLTSVEVVKEMGKGINLGNTMEAYRGWNRSTTKPADSYETLWGQPKTTAEIFKAYKEAGFDSVRIPVAWTNMMNYEDDDYVISFEYLNRVETVVNYALAADLYVIINDHWDGQWWGMFGDDDLEIRQKAVALYKSLWTQVAVRFKNYSEKLIFEGANEELGSRLNDDHVFSNGKKGNLSSEHCYQAVKEINQCFVDVVRATGGNNKNRFLLIPGFDTDIRQTTDLQYKMPVDKAENKLLISVHYYTPSTFCILSDDADWGKCRETWGSKEEIKQMERNLNQMKSFVDKGYGVVIGEYGVSKMADGTIKEGTAVWMSNVVRICMENNYCPMLWDCNTFFKKTEPFGFYDEELAAIYRK